MYYEQSESEELFDFEEEPEQPVILTEEDQLKALGIDNQKELDIKELSEYVAYQTVLGMMHNSDAFLIQQFKGTRIEPIIELKAQLFSALQYMEQCHPSETERACRNLDIVEGRIYAFAVEHFI